MDTRSPRLHEVVSGGKVKGGVHAHLDWLRTNHGDKAVSNLVSSLPQHLLSEISSALPSSWCSFESMVTVDRAMALQFGGNSILKDLGRSSAKINLAATDRLYKRDGIHEFLTRSAGLHDEFQDFGTVEYEPGNDHGGRMIHSGDACFSPTYCSSAIGYYEEALRIHGGRNVIVTESTCQCAGDASCTFVMRWS